MMECLLLLGLLLFAGPRRSCFPGKIGLSGERSGSQIEFSVECHNLLMRVTVDGRGHANGTAGYLSQRSYHAC